MRKFLIGLMALAVIGVACSNDDGAGASGPTGATPPATGTSADPCIQFTSSCVPVRALRAM